MINLIKAELYRLFKSKLYRNCVIASIAIAIGIIILPIILGEVSIMSFHSVSGESYGFNVGIARGASYERYIINAISSAPAAYIMIMSLATTIIVSRVTEGSLKNMLSYGYERWKVYSSLLISALIGISILIIGIFFSILMVSIIIMPIEFNKIDIGLTLKTITVYISIAFAVFSIYMLIASVVPNGSVISVIGMIEILGTTMVAHILPKEISVFLPFSMLRQIATTPMDISFATYFINSCILIGVSSLIGIAVFKRKEIK